MKKRCFLFFTGFIFFVHGSSAGGPGYDTMAIVLSPPFGPVKIMREYVTTYSLRHGNWVSNPSRREVDRRFDREGRVLEETRYGYNGVRRSHVENGYDGAGRMIRAIRKTYATTGELSGRTETEYGYDEAGRKTANTVTNFNKSGVRTKQIIVRWDEDGEMIESRTTDYPSGLVSREWTRTDDGDGSTIILKQRNRDRRVYLAETTIFDAEGRIIIKERRNNSDYRRWSYEYGENGLLSRAVYRPKRGSFWDTTWSFLYDEDGSNVGVVRTGQDGAIEEERSLAYDAWGRWRGEVVTYRDEEGAVSSWSTLLDHRENPISENYRHAVYGFTGSMLREYDQSDRETAVEFIDTAGNAFSRRRIAYNDNDDTVLDLMDYSGTKTGYRVEDLRDSDGRIVSTERYGANGEWISRRTYTYTALGDVKENVVFGENGAILTRDNYEFDYDDQGNWIAMEKYFDDNVAEIYRSPREKRHRDLIYYENDAD